MHANVAKLICKHIDPNRSCCSIFCFGHLLKIQYPPFFGGGCLGFVWERACLLVHRRIYDVGQKEGGDKGFDSRMRSLNGINKLKLGEKKTKKIRIQ